MKNILSIMVISVALSGCSISIGGGSSSKPSKPAYDCSVLSDHVQTEMSARFKQCNSLSTLSSTVNNCKDKVIESVCKPLTSLSQ